MAPAEPPLPAGIDPSNTQPPASASEGEEARKLEVADADQVLAKQEEVLRQVPLYSEARDRVQAALSSRLKLNAMGTQELAVEAARLSDEFWRNGGDLSSPAHELAYQARLLLEQAHQESPNDLAVSDQLVEAIQAYPLVYRDRSDKARQRFRENNDELLAVRKAQFGQIKAELAAGRKPDWADFVRAYDYAWLVQWSDLQEARSALDWLDAQIREGNWSYYQKTIANWRDALSHGRVEGANIYLSVRDSGSGRYRYGHRSPGYVGPRAQQRGVMLTAQLAEAPDAMR